MRVTDFSHAVTVGDLSGRQARRHIPAMRTSRDCARVLPLAAVPLLALLSFPGCSDTGRIFSSAPTRQAAQPRRPAPTASLPVPPTPPPPATVPQVAPVTSEPLSGPATHPEPAQPAIVVTGLSALQLVKLFGEPVARVPTGQGERWTYRAAGCQLDVFMFPDVSHGGLTALDHRASSDAPGSDGERACLRRLRDDHAI
jgi:hypothetical protein